MCSIKTLRKHIITYNCYLQSLFGERHIIPRRLFIIFTAIVVFLPTFIAIFIPNLEFALALTGATSGQLICYILPAIITLHVMPNGIDTLKTKVRISFFYC
ncbi:unnamed protein product [Rotaria sp. Silwood2]|nr:unnamed protein product [Rotaria sp. Silwood2]